MQLWGKTTKGKSRYFCKVCKTSSQWKRGDKKAVAHNKVVLNWMIGNQSQKEVSQAKNISVRTLRYWVDKCKLMPHEHAPVCIENTVIIDTTKIGYEEYVVIARTKERLLGWVYAKSENQNAYERLLKYVCAGTFVTDGHRASIAAIRHLHPYSRIQRCMVHVVRKARSFITTRPRTRYGKDLLELINKLTHIRTRRQKRRWINAYFMWKRKSHKFLLEKSLQPKNGKLINRFKHRYLRGARVHIDKALPHLFTYVPYSYQIPKDTNHVEGGINSRLKELIYRHRGLSVIKKKVLCTAFLYNKINKKPT